MRSAIITIIMIVAAQGLAVQGIAAQTREEVQNELEAIRQVESDSERLEAYDEFVDELMEAAAATETEARTDTGDWTVERSADPMSDETQVLFLLMADEGAARYGRPPALVVRQQGENLEVYIAWNEYLSDDRQRVTHRIDGQDPVTLRWSVSTSNNATFYPSDDLQLVRQLLRADTFVVRTTPYNESPMTITFDVRGFSAAAGQFEEDLPGWFAE